jgi:hypothetical protein
MDEVRRLPRRRRGKRAPGDKFNFYPRSLAVDAVTNVGYQLRDWCHIFNIFLISIMKPLLSGLSFSAFHGCMNLKVVGGLSE